MNTNTLNLIKNKDVNLDVLKKYKIGILGFGNQGRAQALNLLDRGLNVKVGVRKNSNSIEKIKKYNISYDLIDKISEWADILCIMLPDKVMPLVYKENIEGNLNKGDTLLFSHGFNIHYKLIKYPEDVNVVMVAPSGGGKIVRDNFKSGSGVPSLIAVENDYSENSLDIAKAYSKAIGSTRICSFISTFKEETETDLYGEQVLLTGGIPKMINKSLKVLLEAGYSPEVSWFVCYYEIKTIVDLFHDKGFEFLYDAISDTARYGGLTRGEMLIDDSIEKKMKKILKNIQTGEFSKEIRSTDINEKYKNEFSVEENEKIKQLVNTVFKDKK